MNTIDFIKKAQEIHKNEDGTLKYDYSKVNYINSKTKVCIICPKHGEFWQMPNKHLSCKQGCKMCSIEQIANKQKISIDEFIKRSQEIHKNEDGTPKYDYSKVNYVNSKTKVCIICSKHGEFWQTPDNHLNNHRGCPKCKSEKCRVEHTLSFEKFLERANQIHANKYHYKDYKKLNDYVTIICPEHGEFKQLGSSHLSGSGCPKCANEKKKLPKVYTNEFIIEKSNEIHNGKYDYSIADYEQQHPYIEIICPIHGKFKQLAYCHMKGIGCPKCAKNSKVDKEEFIKRSQEIHKNENGTPKYDYSKVKYVNMSTKVCIICKKHGEFWQTPAKHTNGRGCPKCANEIRNKNKILTTENFIEKAIELHGNKYDYSKVEYYRSNKKIEIICKKCGKSFFTTPNNHLRGNGCPKCNKSKLESYIETVLTSNNIEFIWHYHNKWLKRLELDFYLPNQKIAIECQGTQHFNAYDRFGGKEALERQKERDERKKKLCEENGIKLLYYANSKYGNEKIITDIDELLKVINESK